MEWCAVTKLSISSCQRTILSSWVEWERGWKQSWDFTDLWRNSVEYSKTWSPKLAVKRFRRLKMPPRRLTPAAARELASKICTAKTVVHTQQLEREQFVKKLPTAWDRPVKTGHGTAKKGLENISSKVPEHSRIRKFRNRSEKLWGICWKEM